MQFRMHLESQGLSGNTIRNIFKPLRLAFGYAKKKHWKESNPVNDLERGDGPTVTNAEVVIPSQAEIAKLLAEAEKEGLRELVELGFYGLRKGEILGLTWADFDSQASTLNVDKQWRVDSVVAETKTTASVRVVPLDPATSKRMTALRLRSKHSQDSDPIICTRNGTHLLHSNVHRSWHRIRTAAGLPDFDFHHTRHCFASFLDAAGVPKAERGAAGGWKNENVPDAIYTHVTDAEKANERVREAIGAVVG